LKILNAICNDMEEWSYHLIQTWISTKSGK
jgi:hypothetical protein